MFTTSVTDTQSRHKSNQFGAMWQTKYALAVPTNLGLGFDFWPCNEGDFLTGCPQSMDLAKEVEEWDTSTFSK